jgi:hypothetical protein
MFSYYVIFGFMLPVYNLKPFLTAICLKTSPSANAQIFPTKVTEL